MLLHVLTDHLLELLQRNEKLMFSTLIKYGYEMMMNAVRNSIYYLLYLSLNMYK